MTSFPFAMQGSTKRIGNLFGCREFAFQFGRQFRQESMLVAPMGFCLLLRAQSTLSLSFFHLLFTVRSLRSSNTFFRRSDVQLTRKSDRKLPWLRFIPWSPSVCLYRANALRG